MRIVYKRKIIVLASVLLLLLLSVVVLFLYYKDSFFSSKYTDIYTQCERSINGGKDVYTCKAFLVNRLDKGEEECFVFDLVLGSKMINKSICEKKEVIQWSKDDINWGDTEGAVIPIEIVFTEKYNLPFKNLNMVDIAINRLEDEEISSMLNELEPTYDTDNIITSEKERLQKEGYTTAIQNDIELGYVYFKEVNVEEITEQDSFLLVKFSTLFKGQEKVFTVKTTSFLYNSRQSRNEEGWNLEVIDITNYSDFPRDLSLGLNLLYIPSFSSILEQDLETICSNNPETVAPLCIYLPIIDKGLGTVENIDETLSNVVEEDGFLEKFILLGMSKND